MKKRGQPSFLNLGLKKRKWTAVTGTGILCLILAETIISVTGLLLTCNNRLVLEDQFSLPIHSGCQESQDNLVLKIY